MTIPAALEETRVVAILRRTEARLAVQTAEALLRGGISVIEVTLNTPGALEMLRAMRDAVGDRAVLGAGTALDIPAADAAGRFDELTRRAAAFAEIAGGVRRDARYDKNS